MLIDRNYFHNHIPIWGLFLDKIIKLTFFFLIVYDFNAHTKCATMFYFILLRMNTF